MYKVGGFAELMPKYKILEEKMLNIISSSYKQYGYTPIETPMVENNYILTAKGGGEVKNQIFGLYGLANGVKDLKKYSLRFDLTVPFSRYILDYRNKITFPFKRNQIGKVFRGERSQRGRYKDFYQADIDVIWEGNQDKDYLFYDAEVISIAYKTFGKIFREFNLKNTKIKINLNNKKIISGFIDSLGLSEILSKISIVIDKKDKISKDIFIKELSKIGLNKGQIEKVFIFMSYRVTLKNIDTLKQKLDIDNIEFDKGISELKKVLEYSYYLGVKQADLKVNLSIIRGLTYYTGTVFETFIEGDRSLGSVGSGGRYEQFTNKIDPKTNFSGVGFSIGVTRLEDYLFQSIESNILPETTSEYLIINFEDTIQESLKLYNRLISEGKDVEYYPENIKLAKQFRYADKKKIKYCIILGKSEIEKGKYILKDMVNGKNTEI